MRLASIVAVALALSACGVGSAMPPKTSAASPPAAAAVDAPVPDTPVGRVFEEWLHKVNTASPEDLRRFYETRYAPAMNPPGALDQRVPFILRLRAEEGVRHVRFVERSTPDEIVALLESETTGSWWRQHMRLDPNPPHLVLEASGNPAMRPDGFGETGVLDDAAIGARLDDYVGKLVTSERFSGAIAIGRGGRIVYQRAAGVASRAWNAPMTIDTKMNLGSMNKMFTSVAIAQLAQAGKLSYDDTLLKVLPDYPNQEVAAKITIDQLLTHSSGLGDYFTPEYERMAKDQLRAIKDYFPLFVGKPLLFEPGARFSYSNAGFMVLGAIVQKVSGEDYFDYVRGHIYGPAGMRDTDAYEMDHDTPNLAIGYTREGPLDRYTNNLFLHVVKGGPAGGGFSTVGDLVRFASALQGGTILDQAHVSLITSKKIAMRDEGYGYGFTVASIRGHATYGHGGGFAGINGSLTVIPDMGVSVAVLANLDPPAAERVASRANDLVTQR